MSTPGAYTIPEAVLNADRAVGLYDDFARRWLDAMWRGDSLADPVVADGAKLVRLAIAEGIDAVGDAPDALVALFAMLDTAPAWLEPDRCARAAEHLARHHRAYALVLATASLVAGAQNTVAGKPLTFTGRYASLAEVRSIEVGSWLTAVTTPGGLDRDGLGFERTVRVRMIHAHVRAHLSRDPAWDATAWGLPIPQAYMVFTLAEFCSIALRAMARLGVRYRDSELEDIMHLWRYVGHLIGVDDDLLPVTLDDYARIEALYALTSPGADDGDREFIASLTSFQADELARLLPRRWTPAIVHGLQRAFVGDAVADDLAIPDTVCKYLPRVLGPLVALTGSAHDRLVPNGKARRTARALRARERYLGQLQARYGVHHELVDDAA